MNVKGRRKNVEVVVTRFRALLRNLPGKTAGLRAE
jgi:hypothetical protein